MPEPDCERGDFASVIWLPINRQMDRSTSDERHPYTPDVVYETTHWLVFVRNCDGLLTNKASDNTLWEPFVLRKIIGTGRTESGGVVYEMLLSLLLLRATRE